MKAWITRFTLKEWFEWGTIVLLSSNTIFNNRIFGFTCLLIVSICYQIILCWLKLKISLHKIFLEEIISLTSSAFNRRINLTLFLIYYFMTMHFIIAHYEISLTFFTFSRSIVIKTILNSWFSYWNTFTFSDVIIRWACQTRLLIKII